MSKSLPKPLKKSRAPKNTASAFLKRVQNSLSKNSLLPKDSHILVAVSGGSDSIALLTVLARLQKRYQWQLAVAHVNYGLRGADSLKDSQFVQKITKQLGVPFYLLTKKLTAHTSEEKLRTIRYNFFDSLVTRYNFTSVAIAHHQDDQAETVLLRLIRGSGSVGLAGMCMKQGLYVRPFLSMSKSEILDFLKKENVSFRHDKSNDELFYLRNKVRHQLLPLLETYNPKIKKVLASTADTLQTEMGPRNIHSSKKLIKKPNFTLSSSRWSNLSKTEQSHKIRSLFAERALPLPTKSLTETLTRDLSGTLKKGATKEYSRLRVTRKDDTIHIRFKELS